MSALLAYTTEVSASKSIAEIIGMLSQARAGAIMQEFDGFRNVSSIAFRIATQFGEVQFRLPVNVQSVDLCLKEQWRARKIDRRYASDPAHSRRVAWRILRHWLEAQLALVTVGMVKVEQVFLPYAQNAAGQTLYDALREKKFSGLALAAPAREVERGVAA